MSFLITLFSYISIYAQNPLSGVSSGIGVYVPVIRGVIYALAGSVAVFSCLIIYIKSQNKGYSYKKDVVAAISSSLFLVCSAIALPQFFGLDSSSNSGLLADNSSVSSGENAGGGSYEEFEGQPINSVIPKLDDDVWMNGEEFEYGEAEDKYVKGHGGCQPDPEMYVATLNYLDLKYGHVTVQQLTQMAGPFGPEESAWDGLYKLGFISQEQYSKSCL